MLSPPNSESQQKKDRTVPSPRRRQATRAESPAAAGLAAAAAWFLAPVPPRRRPSSRWRGGEGPSFGRLSPQSSSPSRSRVCSAPMLGGGVRFCRWSVTPLRLCFPSGVGAAEATTLQRNNFSQLLPFSDGDLLRRQQRGWGDLSRSRGPAHRRLFQVMIFGGNLSIARVASGGIEGCVVGTGVSRCAWEAVHSADLPSSKPSSAASTL
jgi:hypothetical protein